jgi:hypothetical protein
MGQMDSPVYVNLPDAFVAQCCEIGIDVANARSDQLPQCKMHGHSPANFKSHDTLPDPTRCSGCCPPFALKSSAEILARAADAHAAICRGGTVAQVGSESAGRVERLSQAELSRKSNQLARARIRQFESYMPSHAV